MARGGTDKGNGAIAEERPEGDDDVDAEPPDREETDHLDAQRRTEKDARQQQVDVPGKPKVTPSRANDYARERTQKPQ